MSGIKIIKTPLGLVMIEGSHDFIFRISFGARQKSAAPFKSKALDLAAKEITEFFSGTLQEFTFPIQMKGTEFQKKVWGALRNIPYGETKSYGDIAKRIGNPKASRAVGMANNRNPLPLIIPCHRVIGSNGRLVGYAGGLSKKKFLLELESAHRTETASLRAS